ncbi:MAG: MerR family transcriptional regulator [Lachnospiraceae bacterium]|nr:MerR family transcriptional regulator [Lachnospiraceae bacterium]
MKTVHEVSKMTGVSVRTLHHYDAIGLLKPAKVTDAGYRLYDDTSLSRLQHILLFRELQFPLKEIKEILDCPCFDPSEALTQQIELLELQYKHIGELISYAREIQKKGKLEMDFNVFDTGEIETYKAEAKEKWGNTTAYKEYAEKTKNKTDKDFADNADQFMGIFAELGTLKENAPATKEVQEKIKALQDFITEHYYTCTDEILSGLGEMYVGDERMKKNIDKAGGEGTAVFVREAIGVYCKK